jgi:putative transcriptional regulator
MSDIDYKAQPSELSHAVREMADDFYDAGLIDRITLRRFDTSSVAPAEEITPDDIRALREREQVSQPVFALYLNVSKNLVSDWERGKKRPGGPALRLLSLVRKNGLSSIA